MPLGLRRRGNFDSHHFDNHPAIASATEPVSATGPPASLRTTLVVMATVLSRHQTVVMKASLKHKAVGTAMAAVTARRRRPRPQPQPLTGSTSQ